VGEVGIAFFVLFCFWWVPSGIDCWRADGRVAQLSGCETPSGPVRLLAIHVWTFCLVLCLEKSADAIALLVGIK